MTTTAVFAEVLAIGLEALAWISLAVAAFVDLQPLIASLSGWEGLVTIAVLATAYVVGVIIDRVADTALSPLRGQFGRTPLAFGDVRYELLRTASPLTSFMEYQRSRMRLMRGTVLNLLLGIPVACLFVIRVRFEPLGVTIPVVLLVGGLLVVLAAYSFLRIGAAQDRWLRLVQDHMEAPVEPRVETGTRP